MQKVLLRSAMLSLAATLVLSFVPLAAFAQGGSDDPVTTLAASDSEASDDTNTTNGESLKDRIKTLKEQRQQNKEHRLEANKLQVCERRKAKIQTIMTRSVARAERQLAVFTTISERVEAFYVKKGRTVSNYDELVAAVTSAKSKAQTDLATLQNQDTFDCSADDPKGAAEAFKLAVHSVNQDLKDYRTAVKNLIVAVKSAQGSESKSEGGDQ